MTATSPPAGPSRAGCSLSAGPLSVGQQAMWFLHRIAPESSAYNVALAVRIRSPLDRHRLAAAVAAVEDRHGALRSTFTEVGGHPRRTTHPAGAHAPTLEVREVAGISAQDLHDLARQSSAVPFRLASGGRALRVTLLQSRPDDAVLVVTAHHIVADALSLSLMLRDILTAYRASEVAPEVDTKSPVLAVLPYSYDDFVDSERQLLNSPQGERLAAYWYGVGASSRPARLLPDKPAPFRPRFVGASCELALPAGFAGRLRATSAMSGLTPFCHLLGAFQAMVYRCTGQAEFLIGTAATLRRSPGLRDVVGHLANSLPLAASFHPDSTLAEAAESAGRQVLLAMAHSAYPSPLMGAAAQRPLFGITFTMLSANRIEPPLAMAPSGAAEGPEIEYRGFRLAHLDIAQQEGQFDLSVELRHCGTSLSGVLRYDTDLFDRPTIARLADLYTSFAQAAVAEPHTSVSDVPLLDATELDRLISLGSS